jgi:CelD/BcsL family acetyltransferase involved in cellulose biosynthesis
VDFVDFGYFRDLSPTQAAFADAMGWAVGPVEDMRSFRAEIADGMEAYLARIHRTAWLKTCNRMRAMERDLGARLEVVSRLAPEDLDEVIALHTHRQEHHMQRGAVRHVLFECEPDRQAYLDLLDRLGRHGTARHFLLRAQGRIIAVGLGFHSGRTLFCHLTAFDTSLAKYQPGRVLMLMRIEHSMAAGDTDVVDMAAGRTEVKADFATQVAGFRSISGVVPGAMTSTVRCGAWSAVKWLLQGRAALKSLRPRHAPVGVPHPSPDLVQA